MVPPNWISFLLLGTKADYISQSLLQLGLAIWLNSNQSNCRKKEIISLPNLLSIHSSIFSFLIHQSKREKEKTLADGRIILRKELKCLYGCMTLQQTQNYDHNKKQILLFYVWWNLGLICYNNNPTLF